MHAMPLLLGILCLLAISYRYYSAFLAAKVAALDETRQTPAVRFNDGHNFHPTNKWVLFGHHFAAISGAGPLIGPVLAAQFGYLPGLLWIVIGVCLAGAVQDFLVLAGSTRRGGRSLAQMAYSEINRVAGVAGTIAILFIVIVALAGLGKVVVKALGGEAVAYPVGSSLVFDGNAAAPQRNEAGVYHIPAGTQLVWNGGKSSMTFSESFDLKTPLPLTQSSQADAQHGWSLPKGSVRLVPGSYWGTFTIACTIPIALLVGLYMYKIRPGHVVEASVIGAVLTLLATFAGGMISPDSSLAHALNLSDKQVTLTMAIYGFVASVLPVWVLLCPRDYLSSFLKIGTIAMLVIGTLVANPSLQAPALNHVFFKEGPVVGTGTPGLPANIFPFLFITIMCGAISGFHALVSSGTTPKMIKNEKDARPIGYGAMLIEGLVGVVAMIAAASLPTKAYYDMNTALGEMPRWHDKILQVGGAGGVEHLNAEDPVTDYERLTKESLRGRPGGAVTLAVGMAHIFDQASGALLRSPNLREGLWKYWYHFAIMFEALFILTTIDTGTRIGRFLLQEVAGKLHPALGLQGAWPSAVLSTALVVVGWSWFMNSDSFPVIWVTFGIGNQVLAMLALTIISAYLLNEGRAKYLPVTVIPMLFVLLTTTTAGAEMLAKYWNTIRVQSGNGAAGRPIMINSIVQGSLILGMLLCAYIVLAAAGAKALIRKGERKEFEVVAAGTV